MHRTLQEATTPACANLRLQQKAFSTFRREFNQERPHEALGQKPPAEFYVPSARDYPERLVGWDYPDDWQKRKISPGGQMRWNSQKVHVSHALVDETIGLKPMEEEGLWLVYFRDLRLGHWDEQTRRLRPCRELCYDPKL